MFASRKPAAQPRRIGPVPAAPMALLLQRLRRDQSGNVAMIFGLLVIPLAAMIGLAVDFGRVYSVTTHTQAALDAAALAAGRTAQLNPNNALTQASAAAMASWRSRRLARSSPNSCSSRSPARRRRPRSSFSRKRRCGAG